VSFSGTVPRTEMSEGQIINKKFLYVLCLALILDLNVFKNLKIPIVKLLL